MSTTKKIVLIGPVYPYKGGISHYTGLMCRALSDHYDITMLSYKLQYPNFLFKKEQKNYDNNKFQIQDTKYKINTINPINWLTTASYIKKLKPDYIILQWWHPYFSPCYITLSLFTRKIKKLFICHNVLPHERFFLDQFLTRNVLKYGSGFILHSETDKADLLSLLPNAICEVTPHPTYNTFRLNNLSSDNARKHLHLPQDKKLLLFFGLVREYKGLKYLLKSMPLIRKELPDIHLIIAGDFGNSYPEYQTLINDLVPPNPNELLMSSNMEHIIELLRQKFDYVIIDTAPIGIISDSFLIVRYSDLQLFVTRANYSSRHCLSTLHSAVRSHKLPNAYIVLNAVNMKGTAYCYRNYGNHTGNYSYGYKSHK